MTDTAFPDRYVAPEEQARRRRKVLDAGVGGDVADQLARENAAAVRHARVLSIAAELAESVEQADEPLFAAVHNDVAAMREDLEVASAWSEAYAAALKDAAADAATE